MAVLLVIEFDIHIYTDSEENLNYNLMMTQGGLIFILILYIVIVEDGNTLHE